MDYRNCRRLLGMTVTGVMVRRRSDSPRGQLFLVLRRDADSPEVYFEFFSVSGKIEAAGSSPTPGGMEDVREYMADPQAKVFEAQLSKR